jgi:hypothetical protein
MQAQYSNPSIQYSNQQPQQQQPNNSNQQQPPMGDIIEQLPFDQTIPSHNEIKIVDSLFKQKKGFFDKLLHHTKNILIMGALFVLFSLPQVDNLIQQLIPITTSSHYIFIGIKAVIFMFSYFLIENLYLSRKK